VVYSEPSKRWVLVDPQPSPQSVSRIGRAADAVHVQKSHLLGSVRSWLSVSLPFEFEAFGMYGGLSTPKGTCQKVEFKRASS